MRKALAAVAIAALCFAFWVAHRGAYQGYFFDDDLDNISWTRTMPPAEFATGAISPRYFPQHFRPLGHFTYYALANTAGLDYKPYVGTIHVLHGLAAVAVFFLLRRLGLDELASALGATYFLFAVAAFDALWRPMYLFDVWCGLLCALALLSYVSGRTILAVVCFWFAYKAKEQAVMLAPVLLAYEWLVGKREWKRVVPFLVVAASFSIQAMLHNQEQGPTYRLQLTLPALVQTSSYYASRILLGPYLGLAIVLAILRFVPDRRARFGLLACLLLFGPMLFLPAKMSNAYIYVPLLGMTVAIATALSKLPRWAAVAAMGIWLTMSYGVLRDHRKAHLTYAQENHAYVDALRKLATEHPDASRFVYDGNPAEMRPWGIQGALRVAFRNPKVEVVPADEKGLSKLFEGGPVALLHWDPIFHKLSTAVRSPGEPDASYLSMERVMPIWQLESGWYQADGKFRWTQPKAVARLWRPADAKQFEIAVNVGPQYISDVKVSRIRVLLDGKEIGVAEFREQGWQTKQFALAAAPAGTVRVQLECEPPYMPPTEQGGRFLGSAIGGIGFR
ncbi:MAG: hypothetical protein U0Q16_29385 [Bryobacteraceae bacterium]